MLAGVLELEGEKNPNANSPSSEMMVVPGESGLPGTSWSSDAPKGSKTRISAVVQQERAG
jgi:hypothetical protein